MRRLFFFFFVAISFSTACNPSGKDQQKAAIETGKWRGVLKPQNIEIPFTFNIVEKGDSFVMELVNADERIPLDDVVIDNDSIHIPMYIFDATIHARIDGMRKMNGVWVKNYAEDYIVPFEATYGDEARFSYGSSKQPARFDGKWEVDFLSDEKPEKAVGIFNQKGNKVTGTFLTPTGDYRFLEGIIDGDIMKLSCFDGTHAYLFQAAMSHEGEISGEYWSGKTWHQEWTAKRNEEFELPDPYTMTYMEEGFDKIEIEFPDTAKDTVRLSDEKFVDKVIVIQILGSWCPNCMDETRFYADWYQKNKQRGVEIIGLAFERKADVDYAISRVNKMKEKLGVDYEVLIAGTTSQESRAEALPMLNKIMSFPTSIILDKDHNVRKIHTGFSGPGTGIYYEEFVDEFNLFMDKLITEE